MFSSSLNREALIMINAKRFLIEPETVKIFQF